MDGSVPTGERLVTADEARAIAREEIARAVADGRILGLATAPAEPAPRLGLYQRVPLDG